MVAQHLRAVDDGATDVAQRLGVVEEGDVLSPRQPDHEAQPDPGGLVEDGPAGHGVDPGGVDAERAHLGEVLGHLPEAGELVPPGVGREGAIGHALRDEFLITSDEELPGAVDAR